MNFYLISFSYICLFFLGFIDNSRGPIYPALLKYFNVSTNIGSLIFVLSSLGNFLTSLLAPKIVARFSLLNPSRFGLCCFSVAALLMGIAPGNNWGLGMVFISSLLFGIGIGIHGVTLNLIVTYNSNISNRRKIFSGLHSMYGLASLLAPFIISVAFSFNLSWKDYFLFICAFLVFIIVLSFHKNLYETKDKNFIKEPKTKPLLSKTIPAGILLSFYVCSEVILSSRLALYLQSAKGLSEVSSLKFVSAFFLFLLIGRLFFAFINLKVSSKYLLSLSCLFSLIFIFLGVVYQPVFLSFTGLSMSFFFPAAMDYLGDYFEPSELDAGFSFSMVFVGGSLTVFNYIFGWITSILKIETSILMIPLFLVVVLYLLHIQIPLLSNRLKMANEIE